MRLFLTLAAALVLTALTGCEPSETGDDFADRMAGEHADDTTAASPLVREPASPVTAEPIDYGTLGGETLSGYHAYPSEAPEDGAAYPGVIMIHEWWGLNDNIRAMARRLAGEGYHVLAVDLYDDQVAETPDSARAIMQRVTQRPDRMTANLEAAYQHLMERGVPAVAAMGWCFGGGQALQAALALPTELDAAVIYYGHVSSATRDELATLEMPIMGFFGAEDGGIPVEGVRQFETTLDELNIPSRIYIYEDAGHAFANPTGTNYAEAAATDAWEKTTSFLRETLYNE